MCLRLFLRGVDTGKQCFQGCGCREFVAGLSRVYRGSPDCMSPAKPMVKVTLFGCKDTTFIRNIQAWRKKTLFFAREYPNVIKNGYLFPRCARIGIDCVFLSVAGESVLLRQLSECGFFFGGHLLFGLGGLVALSREVQNTVYDDAAQLIFKWDARLFGVGAYRIK